MVGIFFNLYPHLRVLVQLRACGSHVHQLINLAIQLGTQYLLNINLKQTTFIQMAQDPKYFKVLHSIVVIVT